MRSRGFTDAYYKCRNIPEGLSYLDMYGKCEGRFEEIIHVTLDRARKDHQSPDGDKLVIRCDDTTVSHDGYKNPEYVNSAHIGYIKICSCKGSSVSSCGLRNYHTDDIGGYTDNK